METDLDPRPLKTTEDLVQNLTANTAWIIWSLRERDSHKHQHKALIQDFKYAMVCYFIFNLPYFEWQRQNPIK